MPSSRPRQPQPTISARAKLRPRGARRSAGVACHWRRARDGFRPCPGGPLHRTPSRSGPCGRACRNRGERSPAAPRTHPPCSGRPRQQGKQHRLQVPSLLGQPVLEALGVLAVAVALGDPFLDQGREALAEHVAGHSQRLLDLIETTTAEEELTQNQQRPTLAEKGERPGDRAVELGKCLDCHDASLAFHLLFAS